MWVLDDFDAKMIAYSTSDDSRVPCYDHTGLKRAGNRCQTDNRGRRTNLNVVDSYRNTPLETAEWRRDKEMEALLREAAQSLDRNAYQETTRNPFHRINNRPT